MSGRALAFLCNQGRDSVILPYGISSNNCINCALVLSMVAIEQPEHYAVLLTLRRPRYGSGWISSARILCQCLRRYSIGLRVKKPFSNCTWF